MRAQGVRRTRSMIWLALAGIALAAALVALMVRFASQNPEQANLGSRTLRFDAERLAKDIEEGGPFLMKDPLDRGRDVYVQHLGTQPDEGWTVITAYAGTPDIACLLKWEKDRFVDPCTTRTYPADGAGLVTFTPKVTGGVVKVDLTGAG